MDTPWGPIFQVQRLNGMYYKAVSRGDGLQWCVVQHPSGLWYATHSEIEHGRFDLGGFDDIESARRMAETLSIIHPERPTVQDVQEET